MLQYLWVFSYTMLRLIIKTLHIFAQLPSILEDNIFYSKFFEIICILIDKHAEII